MILRVILIIFFILVLSFGFSFLKSYLQKQPKEKKNQILFKFGFISLCVVLLALIAAGRVHWISAIFAAIIPAVKYLFPVVLRLLPTLLPFYKGIKNSRYAQNTASSSTGNQSQVQTDFLKLSLNHDDGSISGEVLSGPFAGQALDALDSNAVQELLGYYGQQDQESYQLLFAYAERRFDEDFFRDFNHSNDDSNQQSKSASSSSLSRKEALEILGLDESASEEEIIKAHKKMMQKMHPDRGGSHYLAAKINEAKDVLIG